jgi:hypothetical protein
MHITVEKTQQLGQAPIPRSIAYQAKAITDGLEVVAVYGTSELEARALLLKEIEKIHHEIQDLLILEMINTTPADV